MSRPHLLNTQIKQITLYKYNILYSYIFPTLILFHIYLNFFIVTYYPQVSVYTDTINNRPDYAFECRQTSLLYYHQGTCSANINN